MHHFCFVSAGKVIGAVWRQLHHGVPSELVVKKRSFGGVQRGKIITLRKDVERDATEVCGHDGVEPGHSIGRS